MTTSTLVCLQGLRDAIALLDATHDTTAGAAAVGTAAFWACALDEQLRRSDPTFEPRREQHPAGSLLPGVRLVRNAVTHGAVVAIEQREGVTIPLRVPFRIGQLVYRPHQDVLGSWVGARDDRKDNERQDRVYQAQLAGQPVLDAMMDVFSWFMQETGHSLDDIPWTR